MSLEEIKKTEVIDRLLSETPDFWKRIRNVSLIVFVVSSAALSTIATAGIIIPVWATVISSIIISVSGTLSGAAQLTKK